MTIISEGNMNTEKELEELRKVYRDVDRDLINKIQENSQLVAEVKRLKEEVQKLKSENSDLGIEKVKAKYEKEIESLKLELENTKAKITLQSKKREISDKQVQEIKELRASGLSYRAIEEKTKWSRFTIGKAIKGEYDK